MFFNSFLYIKRTVYKLYKYKYSTKQEDSGPTSKTFRMQLVNDEDDIQTHVLLPGGAIL
jgi:hypothetical protein